MPRLMVFGDIHGDITTMYKLVERYENRGLKVDGVVQVGDFGVYSRGTEWSYYRDGIRKATKPTLVLMGNHEDIADVNYWVARPDLVENMKLLLDGRIENFLGVRIGGVWGNYSPKSWKNPERVFQHRQLGSEENRGTGAYSEKIAMHINKLSVENLLEETGPMDILITHDSAQVTFPMRFKVRPMDEDVIYELGLEGRAEASQAAGCPGFDKVLKKFKPPKYYFGHLHWREASVVGSTEAYCLQAIQFDHETCYDVCEF